MRLLQKGFSDSLKAPYVTINLVLAGVIMIIFIYSGFFNPDENSYPVQCAYELTTGMECPSCGMSHSFSYLIRGDLDSALLWNGYSLRLFIFFAGALLLRIVLTIYWMGMSDERRKRLVIADITISSIMFLLTFYPYFRYLFISLF